MVHRTYYGLGPAEAAIREFDALEPFVVDLLGLQQECVPLGPDYMAVGIALDGLQTAAYHFTRRRDFYHACEASQGERRNGNGRLADRAEAIAAFEALAPYADRLRALQIRCRPFGRDYYALDIAKQSLETAAFHFTREAHFYGAKGDSSGPLRPGC
jgi:hypothetical protein